MEIINNLKQIDLFKNLDRPALNSLSQRAESHALKPKDILFNEGLEGSHFYILLEGMVRLFKMSFEGKESTIKIIYPGEFFAEAILYGRTKYPVSAIAIEPSKIIGIHRKSFRDMLEYAESRNIFISGIFDKLRYLIDQIHYISSMDVEERFFRFILSNYGKNYKYKISIPKKELASAIGTIPETFSRLILRLTKMGIIAWKKDTLIIKEGFWDNEIFDDI
jgi:CRP/FNR family transcriptional regulator